MRCFISIDIPENVRKEIIKIQSQLQEFSGKKTEPENLHLTLKFLGEVDEKKVEQLKEKLRKIKFNKFNCEIDSIGLFDNRSSRKYSKKIIVWLHLSNCEKLQKQVDEVLKDIFPIEKRFMSHLTIARVKSIKNRDEFFKKINEIKIPKIKFNVDKFLLKQSILTPKGPIYEILEWFDLE